MDLPAKVGLHFFQRPTQLFFSQLAGEKQNVFSHE
jgi:hypothetical protein